MAYASLVCLTNTLHENIQLNLIPQNSQYIQTLLQEASFFQDFLEKSPNESIETVKCLESRIRDAAYKAQEIVHLDVADRLLDETASSDECFTSLFRDLDEVMEEIDSIKQEVMKIKEKEKDELDNSDEPDLQPRILVPEGSSTPPSRGMTRMVGLEDDFKQIKTRLGGGSLQLEIVALVGMGGAGKTTLAKKVYDDKFIVSHFDTCRWVTVSQEYSMQRIIEGLLGREKMSQENNENLRLDLYQSLKNRRYLIVLDDMWDTKIWEGLKRVLPNDENGSRILLTTRLEQVAKHGNSFPLHHVRFLNDKESWDLFCEEAFRRECCPHELEKIGKEIVRNCRGLPLAVKVIGGHLSKAPRTEHYWRSVIENLSATIGSQDDEQCLRVLSLSYKHLPHHLKGCFLYMGIFPEDQEIKASELVRLWIVNGLIKEERSKSIKDVYKEYFLDLIERNLILVSRRKYNGKIAWCKIHDLIRDLSVKEAKIEKFFHLSDKTLFWDPKHIEPGINDYLLSSSLKALQMSDYRIDLPRTLVNLRFISYYPKIYMSSVFASMPKFVHLHTICFGYCPYTLNIWVMPQLRHVKFGRVYLSRPDPPDKKIEEEISIIVLGKIQTLYTVADFIVTDDILQRIPNIKKLGLNYSSATDGNDRGLNILERLQKLESLSCCFSGLTQVVLNRDITFPSTIKKLALEGCRVPWDDMTIIGSLPNLEMLNLGHESFIGKEWEPNEGEFRNLKTLRLGGLDLVQWEAEAIHFPELQHLFLFSCTALRRIPSGFGEIPTLQLIDVHWCGERVETSARQIEEEQHNFGNEGFQLEISVFTF